MKKQLIICDSCKKEGIEGQSLSFGLGFATYRLEDLCDRCCHNLAPLGSIIHDMVIKEVDNLREGGDEEESL